MRTKYTSMLDLQEMAFGYTARKLAAIRLINGQPFFGMNKAFYGMKK